MREPSTHTHCIEIINAGRSFNSHVALGWWWCICFVRLVHRLCHYSHQRKRSSHITAVIPRTRPLYHSIQMLMSTPVAQDAPFNSSMNAGLDDPSIVSSPLELPPPTKMLNEKAPCRHYRPIRSIIFTSFYAHFPWC